MWVNTEKQGRARPWRGRSRPENGAGFRGVRAEEFRDRGGGNPRNRRHRAGELRLGGPREMNMTLRVQAPIGGWGSPQSWPLPGREGWWLSVELQRGSWP